MTRNAMALLAAALLVAGCAGPKAVAQAAPTPAPASAQASAQPAATPAPDAPLGTLKVTDQVLARAR